MAWKTWTGGRYWVDLKGKRRYYIRRRVNGALLEVRTPATKESAALGELALFNRDPAGYDPRPALPAKTSALYLDANLAKEFLDFSREVLQLRPDWLRKKRAYLAFWVQQLDGVDLRRIPLRVVLSKVPKGRTPARAHKLAVLRSLGEYLTDPDQRMSFRPSEPTLEPEENTLHAIVIPQSEPSQSKGKKRPVSIEHLKLVLENMTGQVHRDALTVLLDTGWHASELDHFVREGDIEPAPAEYRRTGTAAVLVTLHRKGRTKRFKPTRVSAPALAAAERLKAHGPFDLKRLDKALRAACRVAKISEFGPGQVRHVVASHAKAAGASDAQRASFLFHDARTDNRNYAQLVSVERIPTPLDALSRRGARARRAPRPRPAPEHDAAGEPA